MRFLVCSLQLFLSFLLASAANAKLLAKDVNWTDKLVANRTSGCLADNILTDAARKACKTHLIRYALANKCDSKSHGEIFIECSSEDLRDAIIVPSHVYDDFYHTLNLLILLKYDIDATNLNKTENGLNASMALAYHRLKLKTDSVGPLLINELLFFNPTFFFESLENHGSNVVKSREHVFEEIVHDLRQFVLQNRTFALLKLAENLLEQKEANADELRKFNVENVVKKAMSGRAAKFPELKKRIEKFYVNLCTNYTFGIAYKYLEFLAKPNSHEEILTYYKRLFGSGHATFALGISGFFSNHKNPEKFLPLIAEKSTDERAWTDQLMVSAKVGCLSGDRLQHEAKGLCGNPSEAIAENATHFFPHSTLENYKFRMGESCKEAGKFRGIVFQCDIPWFQPSLPSKTLFELYFHDVQMAILVQYAKLAKQMLEAKEKNNAPRFTELKKRLGIKAEAMLEKWLEKTQNFDVYDRHFRYQHYTYNPKIYDSPDHLLTSREYTIRKIVGKLRVSTLVERTKILFKWATKLLKNEEIYEDEMKPFNGEKLLPRLEKISSIDGEVLAGTKERLENSYMSFCKSHTIGVNKYRLDFLEQPNAHKKLAELFRKIFAAGEIHARY
ncbi:hypothetical protein L596_007635 [Steinernema carpocapsae]|uniref:Uncharacterized protein n=1 Tax=Steinernema carpocapsae TaxID=34508 RepID=A0A4U5PAJ1_STECR|nr:hypothetical protein L596_007635 [Steinernema carpocapsae]